MAQHDITFSSALPLERAFLRHVYLLTDAATPVEGVDQLENIVNMYVDPCMQCKLHFVGLGSEASGASVVVKEEVGAKGERCAVGTEIPARAAAGP